MTDRPITTPELLGRCLALEAIVAELLRAHVRAAPDPVRRARELHRDFVAGQLELTGALLLDQRTAGDLEATRAFGDVLHAMSSAAMEAASG
jgi:hypothetical protein